MYPGFSLLVSLVAYARAVGGVWFVSPLPGVWAWVSLDGLPVGLYVGSCLDDGGPQC